MRGISKSLDWVTSIFGLIGSYWIVGLMIIIIIDILGRLLFHHPVTGTPEIVKNSIVGIVFLQLAFVMLNQKHVRSTLIIDKVPLFYKTSINVLSYILGTVIFVGIIISSWKNTVLSFSILEYELSGSLKIPTYPIRAIIIFGSILMIWQCINLLIKKILNSKLEMKN